MHNADEYDVVHGDSMRANRPPWVKVVFVALRGDGRELEHRFMKPHLSHLGRLFDETLHGPRDMLDKPTESDGVPVACLVLYLYLALVLHIAFPLRWARL